MPEHAPATRPIAAFKRFPFALPQRRRGFPVSHHSQHSLSAGNGGREPLLVL